MKRTKAFQAKHIPTRRLLELVRDSEGCDLADMLEAEFRDFPEKVLGRKLQKASDAGLIEYGVSLWRPWLTEAGEAYLEQKKAPA